MRKRQTPTADQWGKLPLTQKLGDAPIEAETREIMNALAHAIDTTLNGDTKPKKYGFILMVFPFNTDGGRCNYVSNAERKEVITLLKEQVARFEGRYHDGKG